VSNIGGEFTMNDLKTIFGALGSIADIRLRKAKGPPGTGPQIAVRFLLGWLDSGEGS